MKEIQLRSRKYPGTVALVDDADFEWLNQFKWNVAKYRNYLYAVRSDTPVNGVQKQVKMHRQILGLSDPKIFGDHKNINTLDNQRSNLRIATPSQNSANRTTRKNGSSKYLGLCWMPNRKRWTVTIKKDGVVKNLGYFKNEKDAALSYNNEAIKLHGEFAKLNVV